MRTRERRWGTGGLKSTIGARSYDAGASLPEQGPCPTPHKLVYRSREEAKGAIKSMKGKGKSGDRGRLHVYLCPCERWHVGTASLKPPPSPSDAPR